MFGLIRTFINVDVDCSRSCIEDNHNHHPHLEVVAIITVAIITVVIVAIKD